MALDFRASQVDTNQIRSSGSNGTNAKLLVYDISVDGSPSNQGNRNPSLFSTSNIGTDVFLYVSGVMSHPDPSIGGTPSNQTVFGGNVTVSGGMRHLYPTLFRSAVFLDADVSVNSEIYYWNTENLEWRQVFQYPPGDPTPRFGDFRDVVLAQGSWLFTASAPTTTIGFIFYNSVGVTGSVGATLGFSGSLTTLTDGTAYLRAGQNISVTSQSNGAVTISTQTGSLFVQSGTYAYTTASVSFDSSQRYPNQIGSDVFFYVSGVIGGSSNARAVFGGDIFTSGAIWVGYNTPIIKAYQSGASTAAQIITLTDIVLPGYSLNNVVGIGDPNRVNGVGFGSNGTVVALFNYPTGSYVSGSIKFPQGLSGSLTQLTDGTSYIKAGQNITITSQSNGAILVATTTASIFTVSDSLAYTTSSVSFDSGTRYPNQIGTDVFFFVSGSTTKKAVFSGDLMVSGALTARQGLTGSLMKLADGTSYLRSGPGIIINSGSNGAITITGSAGATGRLFIGAYTTTTNTSSNPQACGQNAWSSSSFNFVSGSSSVVFQAILSALTASATGSVKLYNVSSGAYVEIGGTGVTALSTSNTTPTKLTSVNLANAVNFSIVSEQIYEVQIYTSTTASTTFLGSAELITTV